MKILIAEKPSVARSLAAIVGATDKKEGYLEGNGYAVTWAFGHLVTLAMPEAYGIRGFQRDNLPILPPKFAFYRNERSAIGHAIGIKVIEGTG